MPGNYGRITSIALDPVEKKPLAQWMPGSFVLSVGSYGCNLHCPWCQNSSIAAAGEQDIPWEYYAPEDLVQLAVDLQPQGNVGIAYTYNEPLAGWQYVRDTAQLAHAAGLKNVLVSNGCASEAIVKQLLPLIDAANIDLKGPNQDFYDICGGSYSAVCRTIELMATQPSLHLEVTTLIIPGLNDDPAQIAGIAQYLAKLDPDIVYHVSRFFPRHLYTHLQPTSVATVYACADAARQYLPHVYTGNC